MQDSQLLINPNQLTSFIIAFFLIILRSRFFERVLHPRQLVKGTFKNFRDIAVSPKNDSFGSKRNLSDGYVTHVIGELFNDHSLGKVEILFELETIRRAENGCDNWEMRGVVIVASDNCLKNKRGDALVNTHMPSSMAVSKASKSSRVTPVELR